MLPVIIVGVSALAVLVGVKKGIDGATDIKKAKMKGEDAVKRHTMAANKLEAKRRRVVERATSYSNYCNTLRGTTFKTMVETLEKLEKRAKVKNVKLPADVGLTVPSLENYRLKILQPQMDALGLLSAAGAGMTAASSTAGLVALLGTAGTGTAISALSGAAATNATLAWLGGGSLATGGLGMAGGAVVLAGVTLGPALAITGFIIAAKGEKALTQARKFESKVNKKIEELKLVEALLEGCVRRMDELQDLLHAINHRASFSLQRVETTNFDPDSDSDVRSLATSLQLVAALSEIMSTPILVGDNISEESYRVQLKYAEFRS